MKKNKRKSSTVSHSANGAGPSRCSSGDSKRNSSRQVTKGPRHVQPDIDIVSGFAFLSFASLPELEAHIASNELKTTSLTLTAGQKHKSFVELSPNKFCSGEISPVCSKKSKSNYEQQPNVFFKSNHCGKRVKSKYLDTPRKTIVLDDDCEGNFEKSEVIVVGEYRKNGNRVSSTITSSTGTCCVATKGVEGKHASPGPESTNAKTETALPPKNIRRREKKKKSSIHTSGCQTRFRIKKKPKQTKNASGEDLEKVISHGCSKEVFDERKQLFTEDLSHVEKLETNVQSFTGNKEHLAPLTHKEKHAEKGQKTTKKARKRPKIEKIEWCARSGGFDSLQKYRLLNKKYTEQPIKKSQQDNNFIQLETTSEGLGNSHLEKTSDVSLLYKSADKCKTENRYNKITQDNSESDLEDLTLLTKTDFDSSIADDSLEDYSSSDVEFLERQTSQDKDRMLGNTIVTLTESENGEEDVDISTVTRNDKSVSFLVVGCGAYSTCDGLIGHFSRHPEATTKGTVDVSIQLYASEIAVVMKYAVKQPGYIVKLVSPDSSSDIHRVTQVPKCLSVRDKVKSVRSFTERKRRHALGHLFNGIKSEVFGNEDKVEMYISKQAVLDKAILTIHTLQKEGLELCKKKYFLKKKNEELTSRVRKMRAEKSLEKCIKSKELASAVSKISLEETSNDIKELEEQLGKKSNFWKQFKESKLDSDSDSRMSKNEEKRDEIPSFKLGRNSRASDELKMALGIKPVVLPTKYSAKSSLKEAKAFEDEITEGSLANPRSCRNVKSMKPVKSTSGNSSKSSKSTKEKIICNLSRSGEGSTNFHVVTNKFNLKEMDSKNVMHIKIANDVVCKLQEEPGKQVVGKQLDQIKQLPDNDSGLSKLEKENQTSNKFGFSSKKDGEQTRIFINLLKSDILPESSKSSTDNQGKICKRSTADSSTIGGERAKDSKHKKFDLETLTQSSLSCTDQIANTATRLDTMVNEHLKQLPTSEKLLGAKTSCTPITGTKVLKDFDLSSLSQQNLSGYPMEFLSHVVKSSRPEVSSTKVIDSVRVSQAHGVENSIPCSGTQLLLSENFPAAQQSVLKTLEIAGTTVCESEKSRLGDSVVWGSTISSQNSRQQFPTQFVNNPTITNYATPSRLETSGRPMKMSQPSSIAAKAVQLPTIKTCALSSPAVVNNIFTKTIQASQIGGAVQAASLANDSSRVPLQNQDVNLLKSRHLNSSSSTLPINPVQVSDNCSNSAAPSLSIPTNEAIDKLVRRATLFSSFQISPVCSKVTSPPLNQRALQSTFTPTTRACMQVPYESSTCRTQINQPLPMRSPINHSQPNYYSPNAGVAYSRPSTSPHSSTSVNIARHFLPVHLPVLQNYQTNALTPLHQSSGMRLAVPRKELLPVKPLRGILPAISAHSSTTPGSIHGKLIDDFSDVQTIINSLPTPSSSEPTTHSPFSAFQSEVAVSHVVNLTTPVLCSSTSRFRTQFTDTMATSDSTGAVNAATSRCAGLNTFNVMRSTTSATHQEADKSIHFRDNFMSNVDPQQRMSNQAPSSLEQRTPIEEILDINFRSYGSNTEKQGDASPFDIDRCVSELLKTVREESIP